MEATVLSCPRCGLANPEGAMWCDCGYDFRSGTIRQQPALVISHGSPALEGIGGWLILFAIALSVAPLLALFSLFSTVNDALRMGPLFDPAHRFYSPWWGPLVVGEVLSAAIALVATSWLLVLFFGRRARFPLFWVRLNVLLAALATLDAVGVFLMLRQFPELSTAEIRDGIRVAFYQWIGLAIWSSYLRKSRRVENTFVQ